MEKIRSPKEVREIVKRLTPEQRKAIEAQIADVFAKHKRSLARHDNLDDKNLYRSCPRCNGYVGIVLREPGRRTRLQAAVAIVSVA